MVSLSIEILVFSIEIFSFSIEIMSLSIEKITFFSVFGLLFGDFARKSMCGPNGSIVLHWL
jgi:hypothetical protein